MHNTNIWIIFWPKTEKVTEGCRKTIRTSQCALSAQYYWDKQIVEYKMGRAGSMGGRCGKLTHKFCRKTRRDEVIWKTKGYMARYQKYLRQQDKLLAP